MAEKLAQICPSLPRRLLGCAALGGLGVLFVLVAFLRPPAAWSMVVLLLAMGGLALGLCAAFYRATVHGLVLTEEDLSDTSGRCLARIADIHRVERGFLAFRPSNGFALKLKTWQPRAWAPGLWWRIGRHIGVGGVISGSESRAMADLIGALIAAKNDRGPN